MLKTVALLILHLLVENEMENGNEKKAVRQ